MGFDSSRSGTGSPLEVSREARATFLSRFFSARAEFFLFHSVFLCFFFFFLSLLHPTQCERESASALHAFNSPSGTERPCRSAEQVSYYNSFFLLSFLFSVFAFLS